MGDTIFPDSDGAADIERALKARADRIVAQEETLATLRAERDAAIAERDKAVAQYASLHPLTVAYYSYVMLNYPPLRPCRPNDVAFTMDTMVEHRTQAIQDKLTASREAVKWLGEAAKVAVAQLKYQLETHMLAVQQAREEKAPRRVIEIGEAREAVVAEAITLIETAMARAPKGDSCESKTPSGTDAPATPTPAP